MARLRRTVRTLSACLIALALLAAAGLLFASRFLERSLTNIRVVDGASIRVHNPEVSLWFAVTADSLSVKTPAARWLFVRPSVRLREWKGWRPSGVALSVRTDSLAVRLSASDTVRREKPVFPKGLRFPVGFVAEARIVTVEGPGGAQGALGQARVVSRGAQALHGSFSLTAGPPTRAEGVPRLAVTLDARWRGAALRYHLQATGPGPDTLELSGIHAKDNLSAGFDTLHLRSPRPASWWPAVQAVMPVGATPAALKLVTDVALNAKADWHRDSLKVTGRFRSGEAHPFEPASWDFSARLGHGGGRFVLNAAGKRQTLKLNGRWTQPHVWFASPRWETWRGELAGSVRGGSWTIGTFTLPLDFDLRQARLDTGLRVTAKVQTPDATRIDLRWNGRTPGRLELSGDIARGEPWAVEWTHGHIDYAAARFAGVWEHAVLDITAHVREPRAYGAKADSLVAENRVTSAGYFLKQGAVHRDGETFTGSGQVLWKDATGHHDVTLAFDARHPAYGRAAVAMHVPGPLELTAENLRPARFPYEPLRGLASFDPWIEGRFVWDHERGDGRVSARARVSGTAGNPSSGDDAAAAAGVPVDAALEARWTHDTLRVARAALASGPARLAATAVLPFDGRALRGLLRVEDIMGGSWSLEADRVDAGEVLALARQATGSRTPTPPLRGIVNGTLGFSPATGMTGVLRLDTLKLPEKTGLGDVVSLQISGMGDSLRAEAFAPHRSTPRWYDTLFAVFTRLNADTPGVRLEARSTGGFAARFEGEIPGWSQLRGTVRAEGRIPLAEGAGVVDRIQASGRVRGRLGEGFMNDLGLTEGVLGFRHVSPLDTQTVTGTPALGGGVLRIPDLLVVNAQGARLSGRLAYDADFGEVRADMAGTGYGVVLPGGERVRAQEVAIALLWSAERGLSSTIDARQGSLVLPPSPYRVETGFEKVFARVTVPPARSGASPSLRLEGRLHDVFFQRKWGWRDATSFFTGIGRGGARSAAGAKRTRPWDLDIDVEAVGPRNRIDTDVLRMTFAGDARLTGVYPYLLVNGKMTGLQGEVGQTRQAYALRDFEIKWDNVTVEDGALHVEGEKRVRSDCRPDTRQTCQIAIRLDGRLEDVGFTYETDCAQNTGDPVTPSVLINSMAQGCYVSGTQGAEGNYGSAAFAMLEPALNDRLSRGVARGSGGFIKSTQVSGLSALIGSDSSGLESVALEVESRSVYRTSLKGRAGYHPETKLANPMEYRLAAEYRPPLERIAEDSVWRARLRNRVTVEAAVETRPEGRDIEEERRVRQRAGLRYRHRFWNLW